MDRYCYCMEIREPRINRFISHPTGAYCQIPGESGLRQIKGVGGGCSVCQLWFSEGKSDLDPREWQSTNQAVLFRPSVLTWDFSENIPTITVGSSGPAWKLLLGISTLKLRMTHVIMSKTHFHFVQYSRNTTDIRDLNAFYYTSQMSYPWFIVVFCQITFHSLINSFSK